VLPLALASGCFALGGPHMHDEDPVRHHARCPGAGAAMLCAGPTPLSQWTIADD
jgi:hypothetical protein